MSTAPANAPSRFIGEVSRNRSSRPAMSDGEIAALRSAVPDDPIRLGDFQLACVDCGVAVPEPGDLAEITRVTSQGHLPPEDGPASLVRPPGGATLTFQFATCEECQQRAATLAALTPHLRRRDSLGPERLADALVALDCAGRLDLVTTIPADRLMDALWLAGRGLRWQTRFAPTLSPEAKAGTCSPWRWAHVYPAPRLAIRKCLTDLQRLIALEETATDLQVPPPPIDPEWLLGSGRVAVSDGCLLCGCSAVVVPAARVASSGTAAATREAWTEASLSLGALGGTGPGKAVGHVCTRCREAQRLAGRVWGPTTLVLALVLALTPDLAGRAGLAEVSVPGLQGFGAAVAQARRRGEQEPIPSATAWSWWVTDGDGYGDGLEAFTTDLRGTITRG